MMLISFSLALLALAAGAFLLAQTMKDNLNIFFKVVAYFIIVASFLSMACIGIHGAVRMYSMHNAKPGEMRMRMMEGRWGGGMRFHHGMRGDEFHDEYDGPMHDGPPHDGPHADAAGKDGGNGWGWHRNHEMKDSTQRKN